MDIFSYSRQQSGTYKSPRHPHQASDHNMKTEENDMTKRLHQISAGPSPNAARLFQAIIKEAGNTSKDRDSNLVPTSKVLKNVVNRNHLLDSNTTKDYDVEYFIEQGQKLPLISKKFLPKIDTNKKSDRLAKVEADMYATHQSLTRKAPKQNHNSPSPVKHQKDTWRSAIKYASEEREYLIDGKSGKFSSKHHESGSGINPNIGMRARFSSGALKFMHNNLSGGEEEESNGDTFGFSLMISPVKGSKRAAQNLKKRTDVVRQIRVGSPEQKDKSIDYSELKKAKTRIERQNVEAKKSQKKRNLHKASSSVFQDIRKVEGETEGSYSKESDDEEDVEEKKMGYESKDEDNMTKRKEEKDKAKDKPAPIGLRKGVPSQAAKESKAESTVAIVSKQSKKLTDHILISKVGDKEKESVQMKREQAYKEFMLQLNFSFNIQVKVPTEKTFVAYKYFLGKGNNSMMLKALMKQRWWWVQVDNKEASDINFMWTQLKQNKFIDGLKQKRKSPFDNLEWSGVSSHCNNGNDTTVATTTSFIDSITDCDSDTTEGETKITTVKKTRKSHSTTQVSGKVSTKKDLNDQRKTHEDATTAAYKKLFTNQEIMLMNSVTGGKGNATLYPEDCEEIGRLRKGPAPQLVADPSVMKMCNHLESNYHLANKKALLWNMKSYYEATKQNVFDFLPLTFHVRNGFEDKEYQKFVEYYHNREKEIQEQEKLAQETKESKKERTAKKLRNIWIVKPGENTNRGVGIHVCDSLSQINDLVATTQGNTDGKKRTYLIQQYLDKPLLYNKRKFDIRCYILMTCINGMMKGYWYQDGYIRTASKEFSLKNVTNKFIHLTNDAVQKKAEEYGKFESGNKLSYNDFQKYLDAHHDGNINFASDIYPQIKQLATDAIKGVYGKIDPYRRENSFEVFGLDFMIDTSLRAWLIEVNTNPDINASSPVLTRVIPPMVENALRLTIDQMYPPPAWQTSKKQMLPENLLENNKFELVFDEVEDGPALRSILQADKGATGDLILEIVAEEEEEDAEEEAKD